MTARPRALRRRTITAVALAALTSGLAAAPAATATAMPRTVTAHDSTGTRDPAAVRALLAALPDGVTDAALVRVAGRGMRAPFTGTAGPVAADARFPVGSVTKVFTDAVVLQLVAEHRIGIDEHVRPHLPGLIPSAYGDMTVRQLLDHTSDLPRPVRVPLGPRAVVAASFDADAAARPGHIPAPGDVQQYNGLNSFVAGLLVEEVTGRPFVHELDRRILRPLSLRRTALSEDPTIAWAWAEGGLSSTAADLDAFLKALLDGRLLPPAQQKHLFEVPAVSSAHENTSCPTSAACFSAGGLMGIELNGTRVWGKTGSSGGWTSGIFASTEHHLRTVYTLRPDALATPVQQRARVESVVEAALTTTGPLAGH
ncbi:serine hydrolase domain-containing protein [Streptomyces sp. NPDC048161]|jgi:D-alanyl-D-alanine carboxypeptidase|uniref:serine hydrolase domain-containing protein n=1 Tax=unclassified Streptomyces TaxID=2593676 RepID=UPI00081B63F0|nr:MULTISPECIES: serine hydrolase domain-containing protein [unclassified Streptomyces]MYQ86907.1 serine hydrolase [Streptomyces sp. SID4936]SCE36858.1 D-alanyl-D-alanine carboxypeptidase [Streptomyces sp. DvalAA-43]